MEGWSDSLTAALLVSLRLAPALAFAQPFTLLRVPGAVRVLVAIGLALWLVDARPELTAQRISGNELVGLFLGEFMVGIAIALALQLAFAAVLWAGQVIDIQAGFGLATLADPTTHSEQPLTGTLLAYAGAALFFTTGAQYDLLALWVASLDTLPLGYGMLQPDMAALGSYMGQLFFIAVGLVGAAMLALFLADVVIAFLSRTLPQMNVLVLGFQVKTAVMLLTLPIALALGSALFLRLLRLAIAAPPTYWSAV